MRINSHGRRATVSGDSLATDASDPGMKDRDGSDILPVQPALLHISETDLTRGALRERMCRPINRRTLTPTTPFPRSMPMMAFASLIALASTTSRGIAIAIVGMLIVATALSLISLFIAALPRALEVLEKFHPETDESHAKRPQAESFVPDDAAVTAAIGFVLHTEFQNQLARERAGSKNSG